MYHCLKNGGKKTLLLNNSFVFGVGDVRDIKRLLTQQREDSGIEMDQTMYSITSATKLSVFLLLSSVVCEDQGKCPGKNICIHLNTYSNKGYV